MHTTTLRKVGGSIMMTVPPAVLDHLEMKAGTVVGMEIDGENLIIHTRKRPRYTLEELLSQCDPNAPISDEDREWLDMKSVGAEL